MTYLYSAKFKATFIDGVHHTLPDDVVVITQENYLAVIADPLPGKILSHDEQGRPILVDPPELPLADQLNNAYSRQLLIINTQCEALITAGFWSQALGERYQYSSQINDQLNLNGVVMTGLDSLFACRDEQGVKAFRQHSADQLSQVASDFTRFKLQLLQRADALKQLLEKALIAADLDALQAVNWESGQ